MLKLIFLAFNGLLLASGTNVTVFKVGVILIKNKGTPYDVERSAAAVDLAMHRVNSQILNDSYRIETILRTYDECDGGEAPGIAADLYYREHVDAFIGPGCTYALAPVARLAGYWNIPIVTGVGDSGEFKEKDDFPTLTRMAYCQCRLRKVFGSVFAQYNWTDVTVLIDRDDDYSLILGETLDVGLRKGNYLPNVIKYYGNSNPDINQILMDVKEVSRIVVLSVPGDSVREFMLAAHDLGLTETGEWVFMDVELFPFPGYYWGNHDWYRGDGNDTRAKIAYQSLLRISLIEPMGQEFEAFAAEVKQIANATYGFDYDARGEKVNFFVGAFGDGVMHYGRVLNETLEEGGNISDGYTLSRRMWDRHFDGFTDGIYMDDNGDRDTSYAIQDMDPDTGVMITVAYYWGNSPGYTVAGGAQIHWGGGRDSPPLNEPLCGYNHEHPDCQTKEPPSPVVVALIAVVCSLILGGIATLYSYRRYKLETALRDMSWIIPAEEISQKRSDMQSALSRITLGTKESADRSTEMQMFADVGYHQGQALAIRQVNRSSLPINRSLLVEVKDRRSLQHDNVVRFFGVVIDPPKILVLHDYCPKGSLQDILMNDSIVLDRAFKRSLIDDIVKGMCYIHLSDVRVHGRLRSCNCVVDSRFTLKLTDFGLPSLYQDKEEEGGYALDEKFYRRCFYKAPELLREKGRKATQKGDVYGFAIVLQEIILRAEPYEAEQETHTCQEIVKKIKKAVDPPFRPAVNVEEAESKLIALMRKCWHEDPDQRPTFDTILAATKSGGKQKSLLDNLLRRMEQYATNLETIVADRTSLLAQEQRKTEELLHQILPGPIAHQLKVGKHVQPEEYGEVTIYFSDIVGFTDLSCRSSPLQVVQMLNDLYTTFDSILGNFDVYKVETIGDAYMVVSGLPVRNGHTHVREIARMSLTLLKAITRFRISHFPDEKLQLRIGLNSGSCVAGVVGLKMPRYCLFGDTVNTASRMESNGLPLKIHVGPTTAELLRKYPSFKVQSRGNFDIKGKGFMETFWLLEEIL